MLVSALRACAFVIQITEPAETLKKIAVFFQERKIVMDNLQMHRYRDGGAMIIIHCSVERDRINRTFHLLEQLQGVLQLEKMEAR